MPHTEDELLRASGCNEADDSATIPSDIASRVEVIERIPIHNGPVAFVETVNPLPYFLNNGKIPIQEITHEQLAQKYPPALQDAITMHAQELADLEAECGRTLTVLEATTYRLRQLKNRLIDEMLRGQKL